MLSPAFFQSLQREVNNLFDNFFAAPTLTRTFADPFVDPFAPLDELRERFLGLLDEFPTHYLTSERSAETVPVDKETTAPATAPAAPAATPAAAASAPAPIVATSSSDKQLAQQTLQTQIQRMRWWMPRCDIEERPNEVCLP